MRTHTDFNITFPQNGTINAYIERLSFYKDKLKMKLRYFYFSIFSKPLQSWCVKKKNIFELKGFSFLMHDSTKKVIIFLYIMTDQVL